MADDARKISGLSACNAPEANALLVVTGNTAGTKNTYSCAISILFGNNQSNVTVSNTKTLSTNNFIIRKKATPSAYNDTIAKGSIWWDDGYIYVAVDDNVIKRATLEDFSGA